MPKFCKSFQPRSRAQQLAAIGNQRGVPKALCKCFDPSDGDWENIDPPQPHEWLTQMIDKTPDQSFQDFVDSRPNVPDKARRIIYLQPLCEPEALGGPAYPAGDWPSWEKLEAVVQRFYYPLQVRTMPAVPMRQLRPEPESRENDYGAQYHAAQVMDGVLNRGLPRDAFCVLAVTMHDLYPRPEWNFVYGLARLTQRVGVFSFVRHTPDYRGGRDDSYTRWCEAQLLHRAMKTMVHEIGHMFGMKHCTWYNCLMRGSNGEGVEHQINYLHLCPVCLRKLHWSIGFDVAQNYGKLLELFQEYEGANDVFKKDCDFLRGRLTILQAQEANAALNESAVPHRSRRGEDASRTSTPLQEETLQAAAQVVKQLRSTTGGRNSSACTRAGSTPAIAGRSRTGEMHSQTGYRVARGATPSNRRSLGGLESAGNRIISSDRGLVTPVDWRIT